MEAKKPIIEIVYNDDGSHSHFVLINPDNGEKLWSENPEECKALGFPVVETRHAEWENQRKVISAFHGVYMKHFGLDDLACSEALDKQISTLSAEITSLKTANINEYAMAQINRVNDKNRELSKTLKSEQNVIEVLKTTLTKMYELGKLYIKIKKNN